MPNNAREIVLELLASGVTKSDVAKAIGYGRSSVSRWINEPDYNGKLIEAAVLAHYNRYRCPWLKKDISLDECRTFALRSCPTCNVREVRHWKTCQTCQHKPETKGATN